MTHPSIDGNQYKDADEGESEQQRIGERDPLLAPLLRHGPLHPAEAMKAKEGSV